MSVQINRIYDHFTGIGLGNKNKFHISCDLTLIPKQHWLTRAIQNLLSYLPIFSNFCVNTHLPSVIHAVNLATNIEDPEQAQRATFIVSVLKRLKNQTDPHLNTLGQLNKLSHKITHKIATNQFSAPQQEAATACLHMLKTHYEQSKTDVSQTLKNAENDFFPIPQVRDDHDRNTGLIKSFFWVHTPWPEEDEDQALADIDTSLVRGADIDFQAKPYERTALIDAAYNACPRIVKHLVTRGAYPEIKDRDGYNAFTMAKYYLNKYTNQLDHKDLQPINDKFTIEIKMEQCSRLYKIINNYRQVVDILEPITLSKSMPKIKGLFG